jgi:hypothetical protein
MVLSKIKRLRYPAAKQVGSKHIVPPPTQEGNGEFKVFCLSDYSPNQKTPNIKILALRKETINCPPT